MAITEKKVDQIKTLAGQNEKEQLDFLKKLCMIDSGTGDIDGNKKMIEALYPVLEELEADVKLISVPKIGNHVVARIHPGSYRGKIVLSAHLDTVFKKGDVAFYPFRQIGNVAFGLGAADCKGGVTVALYGIRIAKALGILPDEEICVIFNCDEETGSESSKPVFQHYAAGAKLALVFEPARDNDGIIVSRRSQANAVIEISGKKAHAAKYPEGNDAMAQAAILITKAYGMHSPDRGIYVNCGEFYNDSKINQVADYVRFTTSCRVRNQEEAEEYFEKYRSLEKNCEIPGCSVKVTCIPFSPPMERTKANMQAYQLAKEAGMKLGYQLSAVDTNGGGDASYLSHMGLPVIDGLGPHLNTVHCYEENFYIPSLKERTMLTAIILGMAEEIFRI